MQYLPLFFDVKSKPCLVVGGGAVAFRKANLLHKAGACLHIVAPIISNELIELAKQSGGTFFHREYSINDLDNKLLVIAATNNESANKQVSEHAQQRHLPVNVVDNPALCSFILPSIIDRSPLMIAVSSGGASPILARLLRSRIESMIPAAYGRLAGFVGHLRKEVKDKIVGEVQRRRFWENILQGPVAEKVLAGKEEEAKILFDAYLQDTDESLPGEVCLVGAGPGDPDLLTFKALRLLQSADVVLYDRLVSDAIVGMARIDADKIYVGKARSNHAVPQQDINQMLIDFAMQGKRVVRLKGGDPFIFGRGGEEIEGLAALNIPFQVVPGVTAAAGCASYAGIPLTHRDYAQSVRFVTAHLKDNTCNLPWKELVHNDQTVVFYMGLNSLSHICRSLIEFGRSENTPIALIQKGTTVDQKVWIATLATMCAHIENEEVKAPTLIIVGEVVDLHRKLAWFTPKS